MLYTFFAVDKLFTVGRGSTPHWVSVQCHCGSGGLCLVSHIMGTIFDLIGACVNLFSTTSAKRLSSG